MGHQVAKVAVVACIDPRIQEQLDVFRKTHGLNGSISTPHHIPGPSLNIEDEFGRIDVAVRKLGATQIFLLDHAEPECLGFAIRFGAGYDASLHERYLQEARAKLALRYPDAEVRTFLMRVSSEVVEVI